MVKDLVYCDDHRLVFEVGRGGVITKAPIRHTNIARLLYHFKTRVLADEVSRYQVSTFKKLIIAVSVGNNRGGWIFSKMPNIP